MEISQTEELLKRDFFNDLWEILEDETKKLLVNVEMNLEEKSIDEVAQNISHIIELEVKATMPLLSPLADFPDRHKKLVKLKEALEQYPITRSYIDGFKVRSDDKSFLMETLPDYIGKVIICMNYFKKDESQRNADNYDGMVDEVINLRKYLLGIGREGILPKLVNVKRILVSYPPGTGGSLP